MDINDDQYCTRADIWVSAHDLAEHKDVGSVHQLLLDYLTHLGFAEGQSPSVRVLSTDPVKLWWKPVLAYRNEDVQQYNNDSFALRFVLVTSEQNPLSPFNKQHSALEAYFIDYLRGILGGGKGDGGMTADGKEYNKTGPNWKFRVVNRSLLLDPDNIQPLTDNARYTMDHYADKLLEDLQTNSNPVPRNSNALVEVRITDPFAIQDIHSDLLQVGRKVAKTVEEHSKRVVRSLALENKDALEVYKKSKAEWVLQLKLLRFRREKLGSCTCVFRVHASANPTQSKIWGALGERVLCEVAKASDFDGLTFEYMANDPREVQEGFEKHSSPFDVHLDLGSKHPFKWTIQCKDKQAMSKVINDLSIGDSVRMAFISPTIMGDWLRGHHFHVARREVSGSDMERQLRAYHCFLIRKEGFDENQLEVEVSVLTGMKFNPDHKEDVDLISRTLHNEFAGNCQAVHFVGLDLEKPMSVPRLWIFEMPDEYGRLVTLKQTHKFRVSFFHENPWRIYMRFSQIVAYYTACTDSLARGVDLVTSDKQFMNFWLESIELPLRRAMVKILDEPPRLLYTGDIVIGMIHTGDLPDDYDLKHLLLPDHRWVTYDFARIRLYKPVMYTDPDEMRRVRDRFRPNLGATPGLAECVTKKEDRYNTWDSMNLRLAHAYKNESEQSKELADEWQQKKEEAEMELRDIKDGAGIGVDEFVAKATLREFQVGKDRIDAKHLFYVTKHERSAHNFDSTDKKPVAITEDSRIRGDIKEHTYYKISELLTEYTM